jgi:LuxR family maltose regulon positive regulatory protein
MRAVDRQDDTGDLEPSGVPPIAGLVLRTRLLELLDGAPPRTPLWITAPPGAGKTALAAAWAESRWRPADAAAVLWYEVEESDADPLRLFATLGGFLGLPHGFGTDIPPEPTPQAFAEIAGAARRWLDAAPPGRKAGPRLIVFDDVHHVPPEAVTIALLPVLAAALPPEDRILCLSRLDPPDPAAVAGPIVDLRVTAAEYPDFARDLPGGRALPRELFLAGVRRAGGWLPGVLAALTPALLQVGLAGPGENEAAERRLLLATAFLQDGGTAEWAELGGAEAPALLDRLAGAGGLVSRLPGGGLRKQDAFQAALEEAAADELPAPALDRARTGAARLLGRRGAVLPAARLLLAAGAGDEALNLVLDHGPALSLAGRNRELLDALELFPAEVLAGPRPRIWLAYTRMPYEPRQAQQTLAEIRRALAPETAPLEYAWALNGEARAVLSDFFDFRELPRLVEQIDDALPRLGDAVPPAARQTLTITRCMAILIGWPDHPDAGEVRRWIEAALPFLPPTVQLLLGSVLVNHLIWWRGDLAAARPFLGRLETLARQRDMAPLSVMTWYYAALSEAYLDGDDEALRRLTDEVVAFAGDRRVSHRLTNAFWVVVQAMATAGDRAAAESMLQRYAACAQQRWRRTDFIGLHHLRAVMALCVGDTTAAIAEGGQALDYARRHGGPHQIAAQGLLLATAHAMAGDEAARPHIETLREVAGRTGNATFLLHADLAEAFLAAAAGGDVAGPWNRVAEAASRLGFRRIAGMNRPALARLADRALAAGAEAEPTRRVIALWDLPPPEGAHELWPFPVEIRALGGFAVQVDGARVAMGTGKAQRKPMELLWCLIAGPAEGWAQEDLADQLWPELDGDRAIPALRTTVYRLRKLIGARAIRHEDDHIGLAPAQVRTDVTRLRAALSALQDPAAGAAARLAAFDLAIGLVRGPLLPGIRLLPIVEARDRLQARLAAAGAELLLAQDPADPATALRAGRLHAAAPGLRLPPPLVRLAVG